MGKIKVAIIGAGAIAPAHINGYLANSELCEIKAVCNTTVSKAQKLIKGYELDALAVSDYHEVINSADIDAVSICLPPSLHASVAIEALCAGKHVLCEKPMAGSLEECDAMIRASEDNDRILGIVAQNRYKTPYWKMKKLLEEKALGDIRFATVDSLWWRGENYYDIWWRGTWEKENGGCVLNHAVHHIDLMQWMFGMPDSVSAVITNAGHHNSECEDLGVAVLQYSDMAVQMTASLVTHNEAQEIVVQGEKAGISVPWGVWASKPLANGFPEEDKETETLIQNLYDSIDGLPLEGHDAEINNFLKAITGGEKLLISGKEGRNTIELITAVYKSSFEGKRVTLPIKEDDPFYFKGGTAKLMPHFFEKTKSIQSFTETKPITLGRDVGK